MDLRQLRYFVTLSETMNFHRAAERLHISQPPLTVAIRKLEEELNVALFHRHPRGVSLTSAGEAALGPAREALAQAAMVRRAVEHRVSGESGRLVVGFVGSAIADLIPGIIPAFRERYPQVELSLEEGVSSGIVRAVEAGDVDIGLVRVPLVENGDADVVIEEIERDDLVAALKADHPLAGSDRIELEALKDEHFIVHGPVSVLRSTVVAECHRAGFRPRIEQEATQVQTILSLVQSGLGVALVPARSARVLPAGVKLVSLAHPVPIVIGIAHVREPGAVQRNFLELARQLRDSGMLSKGVK